MSREQTENLIVHGSESFSQNSESQYPGTEQSSSMQASLLQSSEPLWKRAPTRDHDGKPYADFMMLIPGLRDFEAARIREIVSKVESVLNHYEKDIILADLNLKINVLWVTLQPHLGLSTEIAALIHHAVPEAKLVSQHRAP